MKKHSTLLTILLTAVCTAALFCVSGCNSAMTKTRDAFFVAKPSPPVTNSVVVFAPEDVLQPAKTNLNSGVITPAVPKPGAESLGTVTVIVQPPPTWEDSPNVQAAKDVVGVVPGYGPMAGLGIGLLAAVSKLWLNRKQTPIIGTTFKTIEDWANAAAASGDPKAAALADSLKKALAKAHDYADVMPQVQQLIDAYTGHSGTADDVVAALKAVELR